MQTELQREARRPKEKAAKEKVDAAAPVVFKFLDYREFLRDWFQYKKMQQPGFSCTVFARITGMKSHAFFGMVISGKRNLTHKSIRAFAKALALKPNEYNYFEKLVLFNQATSVTDRNFYFEQLRHAELSSRSSQQLVEKLQNASSLLRHWYTVAIFEMTKCADFRADKEWLSSALKNRVTPLQAQDAWNELVAAKLLVKDVKTGHWIQNTGLIDIDPARLDFVIQNFHLEMLRRSSDAIQNEPLEDRELSSLTLAVTEEDWRTLRGEIKEFRKRLNREYSREESKSNRVIAVNMQLLCLTEKTGECL
jgi:uncharacterized protein (TIGR02147 family)